MRGWTKVKVYGIVVLIVTAIGLLFPVVILIVFCAIVFYLLFIWPWLRKRRKVVMEN